MWPNVIGLAVVASVIVAAPAFAQNVGSDGNAPAGRAMLACSGTAIVTNSEMQPDMTWSKSRTPTGFNFTLEIDIASQLVTMDGRPMTVRRFTEAEVVFSRQKSRLLAGLKDGDYVLNRRTGVIRFIGGSGQCRRIESAPVF